MSCRPASFSRTYRRQTSQRSHMGPKVLDNAGNVRAMRPGSNHRAKLEPAGSQRRINFLPSVLARLQLALLAFRESRAEPATTHAENAKRDRSALVLRDRCAAAVTRLSQCKLA